MGHGQGRTCCDPCDPCAETLHRASGVAVVDARGATRLAGRLPEGSHSEQPLVQLHPAPTQRIVEVLAEARAETVERHRKPAHSNLCHHDHLAFMTTQTASCQAATFCACRSARSFAAGLNVSMIAAARARGRANRGRAIDSCHTHRRSGHQPAVQCSSRGSTPSWPRRPPSP